MIAFNRFTLSNGLRVLVHEDNSTPFVVVNLTYDVGAKDEHPNRTGFAHLFEHLMFGGSQHAPNFDQPLELAGATNNAFTNNDITNYYEVIPRENIETALWLESDRMQYLTINDKSLSIQQMVVIEEFKERYLNKPYGKTWHYLRDLAYTQHPYRWPTIGLTTEHIAEARLSDVKQFYERYYQPSNAVLTLAGNITFEEAKQLATKWFGDLENKHTYRRNLVPEPRQTEARRLEITDEVPADSVHIAFHMPGRNKEGYYECDLISDVLGSGESSRLQQSLVKEKKLFSSVDAYILGSFENGLFIINGRLSNGVNKERAEEEIWNAVNEIKEKPPGAKELQKVQNKVEANLTYQLMEPMHKALNLAFYEIMGDANDVNHEAKHYQAVTQDSFEHVAAELFRRENSNTLWQLKSNK